MLSTVDLSFRRRALTEAARYGSDPWVFVRELLQNARDAGAREVTLTTSQVSSSGALRHRIACCDDGQGMTYEHARRYLFSLYASSKDDDLEQAGKFGIGFWSILRLAPTAITIRSRAATGKAWEVTLDGDLEQPPAITTDLPSSRFAGRGTEVILELPLDAVKTVAAETTEAAKHYGRFLTCRDDPEQPLNIRVDGLSVNATFTLPAPSAAFSGKGFRGVVGLGEEPEVELFAQGLFVRSAPSLLDLREDGDAPNRAATEEALAGLPSLAPRILIDSAELDLMLARSDVRFDKHMRRILAGAEKALARLIRKQLQAIRPQPWYRPLLGVLVDRLQPLLQWRPQLRWRYAAAGLAGILLGTAVLWWLPLGEIGDRLANGSNRPAPPSTVIRHEVPAPRPDSPRPGRSARRMRIETGPAPSTAARPNAPAGAGPASQPALRILPYADLARSYSGPHLGGLQLDDARTGIMYEPSDGTPFFNALVIDRLQAEQWEASRLPDALPRYRETPCQENCLDVRLLVADGPTPLRVPVATGHRLDASSVRLNGDSVAVFETEHGEAILQPRDRRQGLLEYRSGPAPAWPAGTEPSRRATLDPGTASPPLREVAAAIRPLPIAAGVQQALDFVARTITYDRTPATLRAYGRAVRERSDFVTAALDVGAGDCDVQNGVLLTLLRLSGIEARLVLGYVGLGGTVATGLHAWVEYLDADGRWSVADASITGDPEIHHPLAHPPESSADPSVGVSIPHRVAASLDAPGQQARTFGLAALLILGLGTTAWLARRRVGPQVELGPDENLAALLGGALRHPEAFAGLPAMFHGRFVPLLDTASAISLDRARRLGAQNRLFRSGKGSDLARKAAARGIPVIDAAAPEGRVTSVALGAIDLDRWSGLLQQSLETRLCSRINERLEALHAPWRVREVSGLPEPWTEVALEDLRLGRRLMLLDMDQLEFAPARRLLPQQLDAAAFTTLDVLLHRLDMSDRERAKILAAFAESAVSEAVHSEAVQPEAVSSGAVQSEAVETETVPPGDLP